MKKILLFLTFFSFYFSIASAEDRSQNPLYKALPPTTTIVKELIARDPSDVGFLPVPFRESLEVNWQPTEDNFFEDIGIQIAQQRFEEFTNIIEDETPSIPPLIHLIWMGSPPPEAVHLAVASWEKYHPNWQVKLWTEEEIAHFQWSSDRSKRLFDEGRNWAEKSDIFRFEILYQFGGIYADTDVVCLKSFEDLIRKNLTFFAGLESNQVKRFGRPLVGSALIGAASKSSVIKACIDFTQSIIEAPHIHQHIRSGPGPITKASYQALELNQEGVLILPCSYFYPLPWEKRLATVEEIIGNIQPESYAIHLWEGSWFDSYHPPKKTP